jgi:hypothetical protein
VDKLRAACPPLRARYIACHLFDPLALLLNCAKVNTLLQGSFNLLRRQAGGVRVRKYESTLRAGSFKIVSQMRHNTKYEIRRPFVEQEEKLNLLAIINKSIWKHHSVKNAVE